MCFKFSLKWWLLKRWTLGFECFGFIFLKKRVLLHFLLGPTHSSWHRPNLGCSDDLLHLANSFRKAHRPWKWLFGELQEEPDSLILLLSTYQITWSLFEFLLQYGGKMTTFPPQSSSLSSVGRDWSPLPVCHEAWTRHACESLYSISNVAVLCKVYPRNQTPVPAFLLVLNCPRVHHTLGRRTDSQFISSFVYSRVTCRASKGFCHILFSFSAASS